MVSPDEIRGAGGPHDVDDLDDYYRVVVPWLDRSLRERGDLEWWSERIPDGAPGPVLEVGCGTGRVTACFAGGGRTVVGLDRSDAMLSHARGRLADRSTVHLLRADFRALPLCDRSMRWVVVPDDPLIHLVSDADRQLALDEIARVLRPDGRLFLELLWWRPEACDRARSSGGLERVRKVEGPGGEAFEVREHWRESGGGGWLRGTYRYVRRGVVLAEASFEGRRWTREELDRRLQRSGLETVAIRGGFDGRAFDPETARALLVEARPVPTER